MTYKFNVDKNGNVGFLMSTGNDFVKNVMMLQHAENTAKAGDVKKSNRDDYPICVDDKWYFEGEIDG